MTANNADGQRRADVEITTSWKPQSQPVPSGPTPPPTLSSSARSAAAVPLSVLVLANALAFAYVQFSDVSLPIWIQRPIQSLYPLVSTSLMYAGRAATAPVGTPSDVPRLLAIASAVALVVVVRSR